jgi:hypothetical protein
MNPGMSGFPITTPRQVFNHAFSFLNLKTEAGPEPRTLFTVPRSATGRPGLPPGAFFIGVMPCQTMP